MLLAAWDSTTTAIMTGIALGIIGVIGTGCVALYSKLSAAGLKADSDRMADAIRRECERGDRLEVRLWKVEESLRECEKSSARWQAMYEGTMKSSPPKSANA